MGKRLSVMRQVALSWLAAFALALGFVVPATSSALADPVCTITGTAETETLEGTSGNDVICTNGGDDVVNGGGGTDTVIITGGGHVNVTLGAGNDVVDASGADSLNLSSGAGNDTVTGSPGNDEIYTGDGNDTIRGDAGDDVFKGGAGNDTLFGGSGDDTLWGEVGADTLKGEEDDDIIAGGDGVDKLDGGFGLNNCDYTTNEIKTRTCLYDSQAPNLRFAVNPTQVDSGSDTRRYRLTVHATDANGIASLSVDCLGRHFHGNPMTAPITDTDLDLRDWELVVVARSGTRKDLIVTFEGEIAAFKHADSYNCIGWGVDDLGNNGWRVPKFVQIKVVCENVACDSTAPRLTWISVPAVEVGQSDAVSRVHAKVTENIGIRDFYLYCRITSAQGSEYAFADFSSPLITHVGNKYDLLGDVRVPAGQYPGKYWCQVGGYDLAGNILVDARPDPTSNVALVVKRSSGNWDDAPPSLISGTFTPSRLDVGSSSADSIFTVHATDTTGIKSLSLTCMQLSPAAGDDPWEIQIMNLGKDNLGEWFHDAGGVLAGDEHELTYSMPVHIPFGRSPGVMGCKYRVEDVRGNWATYLQGGDIDTCYRCMRPSRSVQTLEILRTPPGLPQAPTSVTYVADKPTSGTLSWMAPEFPGDPALRDYQISYSTDNKTWKTINDGFSTTTSLPVSNLKPNTDYWFKVRGDNGGNSIPGSPGGTWSQVLKVRTPAATVPDPVTALSTPIVASRSVKATWAYGYNGGASITDFLAEVSADGGQTWKTISHKASTAVYMTVTGLKPATNYTLRVRSKNSKGLSTEATTDFTTLNDVPEAATGLRVTYKDSSSVSIAWNDPVTNGAYITDYQVEYSINNGRTWVRTVHDPITVSSVTLSGLQSKRTYQVRVTPINSLGPGKVSGSMRVTTL